VFFLDGVNVTTNLVRGFRVDRSGNLLWGGLIKDVSSVMSGKGRLSGGMTLNGTTLLTWADKRLDANGVYAQNVNWDGSLGATVGVRLHQNESPLVFSLLQNYPNPFNPTTTILYKVDSRESIELRVFDMLGREVATLVNEVKQPGMYTVRWSATGRSASGGDAGNLASGVYFCRLKAGPLSATRKLLLMK
jgi:hypothetical protein